jgi:hypothetical protein
MYFLFIKLTDISYKEDLCLALQSVGIMSASLMEGRDLSPELSDEMNLFTGFFKSDRTKSGEQLVITATIDSKDQAKELLLNLREGGVDLERDNILKLVLMPVALKFDSIDGMYEA